jgi:hypothetical protein
VTVARQLVLNQCDIILPISIGRDLGLGEGNIAQQGTIAAHNAPSDSQNDGNNEQGNNGYKNTIRALLKHGSKFTKALE